MDHSAQLIHYASCGNLSLLEKSIKEGCSIDFQDNEGTTALQVASANAYNDIVLFLLSKNASVDLPNAYGWTPLMLAARHGHTTVVTHLLKHRAKVNILNRIGLTPLTAAVWSGELSAVKVLLDAGAIIDYVSHSEFDQPSYTIFPIMVAALLGHKLIFNLLLEKGASVEISSTVTGWTPLMLASCSGQKEIVELLIDRGSDKTKVDICGKTAFDIAILNSHDDIKFYLENVFATKSIHVKEKGDEKILKAAQKGSLADVKSVLMFNPECANATLWPEGISALMLASMQGHSNIVKILIENGASLNTQDLNYGWTAVMYAAFNGHADSVAVLIESGADLNVRAFDGYTVLDLAYQIENCAGKIIELLTANISHLTSVTPSKVFTSINLPVHVRRKSLLFEKSPKRNSPSPSNRIKGWINNKLTTVFVNSGRRRSNSPATPAIKAIETNDSPWNGMDENDIKFLHISAVKTPQQSPVVFSSPNLPKNYQETKIFVHTPKSSVHRNLFHTDLERQKGSSPLSEDIEFYCSPSPLKNNSPKMTPFEPKIFGKKGKLRSKNNLSTLLEENLLHKHIAKFTQQEIDFDAFKCLKEEDFNEMGINSTFSRDKLIKILNESKKS